MLKFLQRIVYLTLFVFAGVFLYLPLVKSISLHSFFFDLGSFESLLYRMVNTGEWQWAFAGHAHWFALPFSWLYKLFPPSLAPYCLVSTQAILLLLPALWFYRRFGVFVAFVYIAYCPLWVNTLFDFHFDHLAVPLLMGFYMALLDRKIGLAVLSATLLILVKEPFALQTAACGALMLWAAFCGSSIWVQPLEQINRRWLVIGAVWLLSAGLGYFYFAVHYLLPYFAYDVLGGAMGGEAFGWLGQSLGEILQTITTKPYLVIWDIITSPYKLLYLGVGFGLLAFVPLLRSVFLIPAIPLLAIAILSRVPNYYDYNTHYTAGLIIPIIFAFVYGLPRAEWIWEKFIAWGGMQRWRIESSDGKDSVGLKADLQAKGGTGLFARLGIELDTPQDRKLLFYVLFSSWFLFGHIMLSPSPISRLFWSDKVWSYSWQAYVPTERDAMMKAAMKKFIPADPEVSVTTQNTLNYSHLAQRKVYLPFPMAIAEPSKVLDWSNRTGEGLWVFVRSGYKPTVITNDRYADYVVLDLKRPYFLVDRGCEWIYGECINREMENKFLDWVVYTRSIYDMVFERDEFMILRRRAQ
jgi:uncharacterized membrane protein